MSGVRADLGSTGVKIKIEHWVGQQVTDGDPCFMQYNEKLAGIKARLLAIYNQYFLRDEPFSVHQIRLNYQNKTEYIGFMDGFDRWLSAMQKRRDLSDGSKESYHFKREKVLKFLIAKKLVKIGLHEFDERRFDDLKTWLTDDEKHEKSTVRQVLTVTKQMLRWCYKKKLVTTFELDGVSVKKPKPKDPIFLTVEQFNDLKKPFANAAMQRVADVMVVYCRTGFHYADLKRMAKNADTAVRTGIDGNPWIYHQRLKTDVKAKVPIWEEVATVVEKYGGWNKLPIISNQQMNKWLKLIAAARNWPEPLASKISVKTGRKTLTDWLLNEEGWSEESVKVLLGLRSTESLEPYGRADERRVVNELKRSRELKKAS